MGDYAYSDIARLIQEMAVDERQIGFRFKDDSGFFEQTVVVPRTSYDETKWTLPHSTASFKLWLGSIITQVLKAVAESAVIEQVEIEEAALRAFSHIAPLLSFSNNKWIALIQRGHPGEFFQRQLSASPIVEDYDREVLIRVLLEVSRLSSESRVEERIFFQEVVGNSAITDSLLKAPSITVAELAEVSSTEIKQTILMLAWAMAYADGNLDSSEISRLDQVCSGFSLPDKRVRELQLAAKLALLDRFLCANRDKLAPEELKERFDRMACTWGVARASLSRLRAWYPIDFPEDYKSSEQLMPDFN